MQNWYDIVKSKPERIICAAILRKEPRTDIEPYHKDTNDICKIEIGYRHHDIMQRFGNDVLVTSPYGQGFYTSKGRFVGRHEGMYIAFNAKQVPAEIALLDPKESEKSFVDFMNDMILGEMVDEMVPESETSDILLSYKQREEYYQKLGYKQLFSEDIY